MPWCFDHGTYSGDECPGCEAKKRKRMSKELLFFNGKGRIVEIDPSATTADDYGEMQQKFAAEAGAKFTDVFASMVRLYPDQVTPSGVQYHEELAGPEGMSFMLFDFPDTTKEQLQQAKAFLRSSRDVVRMSTLRIKKLI